MKYFKYILILCFVINSWSCKNTDKLPEIETVEDETTKISLNGTEWKLIGIVDSIGTVKELEPKDCERCYTIIFDSESEAHGYSECNELHFHLLPELIVGGTKMGSTLEDGMFFEKFIREKAKSYDLKENKLRFFDIEKKNYLLYKLIEL
jgi:hypothetical protein